jgi:hypothetical protein
MLASPAPTAAPLAGRYLVQPGDVSATADALTVSTEMTDVPAIEDRLRLTVHFIIDGVDGVVDLERSATGDTVTLADSPFVATGSVDPSTDSMQLTIRKADGGLLSRAVVRLTYTAVGAGIADADWTHGACAVWPG